MDPENPQKKPGIRAELARFMSTGHKLESREIQLIKFFIPSVRCSYQVSSKSPLFTANADHHRKPHLDSAGIMDCWDLSPSGSIYFTAPESMAQEYQEREWKDWS